MRLISMAKKGAKRAQSATVTRRDGWRGLKPGTQLEMVEWSPRVGARCVCRTCGHLGPKAFDVYFCPICEGVGKDWREPRRLGTIEVLSVRVEILGSIDDEDLAREGFPYVTRDDFIALYCAPGKPDPDREVTRIEYEHVKDPTTQ